MRGLPEAGSSASLRARRWDVVVLGGALPGLVAAARLGLDGLRVLVLEEESAAAVHPALREPFLVTGSGAGGVLEACLKALTVPLIERRKLVPEPVAFQLVLPEIRLEVGDAIGTAEELVAWGLAKPEEARALVRDIADAGTAERNAMRDASVVRQAGLRAMARPQGAPRGVARGLPVSLASPSETLRPVLDAWVRALSNLAASAPPPEARGRLLGAGLEGGASFHTAEGFLRGCLQRRIRGLFGEFRTLPGRFDLVTVAGHPGLTAPGMSDAWVGRALVVNADHGLLHRFLKDAGSEPPGFLEAPAPSRRRVAVHLRVRRSVLPEGMAPRVVRLRDPALPPEGTNLVTIGIHPASQPGTDRVELVAAAVVPEEEARNDRDAVEREIIGAALELMPFSEGRVEREATPEPHWDDDFVRSDPGIGEGWPVEAEIRLSGKPPVYGLPRQAVAALGMEGDVLLGWRAAEAIRSELA